MKDLPNSGDGAGAEAIGDTPRDEDALPEPFLLKHIAVGRYDSKKRTVRDILWSVSEFKIYVTDKGISVHFADDPKVCLKQIKQHLALGAELANLHALLDLLGAGRRLVFWRKSDSDAHLVYHREVARGIALALTDSADSGRETLEALAARLEKKLRNRARVFYLAVCLLVTLVIGLLAGWLSVSSDSAYLDELALVATCGSIGALLSTAAALRRMRPDASSGPFMSSVYGGQRMLVGVLGAVVFYFALRSGLVGDILPSAGASTSTPAPPPSTPGPAPSAADPAISATGPLEWYRLAFLSVLAGFSERMVPDLLNRNGGTGDGPAANPAS